jgi:hypothetical protein
MRVVVNAVSAVVGWLIRRTNMCACALLLNRNAQIWLVANLERSSAWSALMSRLSANPEYASAFLQHLSDEATVWAEFPEQLLQKKVK